MLIQYCIAEYNKKNITITPLRKGKKNLSSPMENTIFWLTTPPALCNDPIEKIEKTVQMERDIFNIISIDDHYDFLIQHDYFPEEAKLQLRRIVKNAIKNKENKTYVMCFFDLEIQKEFQENFITLDSMKDVTLDFIYDLINYKTYIKELEKTHKALFLKGEESLITTEAKEEYKALNEKSLTNMTPEEYNEICKKGLKSITEIEKRMLENNFIMMKNGVLFLERLKIWIYSAPHNVIMEKLSQEELKPLIMVYKGLNEILSAYFEKKMLDLQVFDNIVKVSSENNNSYSCCPYQ